MNIVEIEMLAEEPKDLTDPAAIEKYVLAKSRRTFEANGEHRPLAVAVIRINPETGDAIPPQLAIIGILSAFGDGAKDQFADWARRFCFTLDAMAFYLIVEAWMVRADAQRYEGQSLEHVPGRIEVVQVTGEHVAYPSNAMSRIWQAEIKRDGESVRLEPFVQLPTARVEGRLTRFLPRRVSN